MARGDYLVGKATIVGWGLQAVASGTRWDGAPGTLRYNKPMSGGANYSLGSDQNYDDTMDVDPQSMTTGATKHSGSFKQLLSYEHMELLAIAMAGTADAITGVGPYVHTIALADAEVYLTLAYYYEDFKGTKFLRTYTNAIVTTLTLEGSPEQRPTMTIDWIAQSVALTTPGATPTLNTMDLVDWKELTVTANSATACVNSMTFVVTRGADDSDITMGCDAPEVNTLFGNSQRTAQLTTEIGVDDSLEIILEAASTAVTGQIEWTNGGATVALRTFSIPFTLMRAATVDMVPATWGKRKASINWAIETWDGFVITNSLAVAQL